MNISLLDISQEFVIRIFIYIYTCTLKGVYSGKYALFGDLTIQIITREYVLNLTTKIRSNILQTLFLYIDSVTYIHIYKNSREAKVLIMHETV